MSCPRISMGRSPPEREVRLGALPSLYMVLAVPLFFELRKAFPAIRLHVFEGSAGQIDQWLANGFVDLGLPYRYGQMPQADVDPLVQISSCVMGAPGSALTEAPTLRFAMLDGTRSCFLARRAACAWLSTRWPGRQALR